MEETRRKFDLDFKEDGISAACPEAMRGDHLPRVLRRAVTRAATVLARIGRPSRS